MFKFSANFCVSARLQARVNLFRSACYWHFDNVPSEIFKARWKKNRARKKLIKFTIFHTLAPKFVLRCCFADIDTPRWGGREQAKSALDKHIDLILNLNILAKFFHWRCIASSWATVDIMKRKYFPNQTVVNKKRRKKSTRLVYQQQIFPIPCLMANVVCWIIPRGHPTASTSTPKLFADSQFSHRALSSTFLLASIFAYFCCLLVPTSLDAFNSASHCTFFTTVYLCNSVGWLD